MNRIDTACMRLPRPCYRRSISFFLLLKMLRRNSKRLSIHAAEIQLFWELYIFADIGEKASLPRCAADAVIDELAGATHGDSVAFFKCLAG